VEPEEEVFSGCDLSVAEETDADDAMRDMDDDYEDERSDDRAAYRYD